MISTWLPTTREGRTFVLISFIDSLGTGLFLACSAIFFVRVAGLTAAQVGLGLAIGGVAGLATTVPLGVAADHLGGHKMLIGLHLWRAFWFAILAFTQGFIGFAVVSCCIAIADRAVSPVRRAVMGVVVGTGDRVKTLAAMRSVYNVGFSLGAVSTAPLIAFNQPWMFRALVLMDALSFVVAAVMLARLKLGARVVVPAKGNPFVLPQGFRDWRYLSLAGLDGALSLHAILLTVAIPLWVIGHTTVPASLVPLLILINTIMAVVLQVPFAKGGEDAAGGVRAMRRSGLVLAAGCVFLAATSFVAQAWAVTLLVVAIVAISAGEMWQSVGSWSLSHCYAPENRRGEYLSIFGLGVAMEEIVGPALLTMAVLPAGTAGWVVLAGGFCVISLAVRPLVAALENSRLGLLAAGAEERVEAVGRSFEPDGVDPVVTMEASST